jgi:hypothetical protein
MEDVVEAAKAAQIHNRIMSVLSFSAYWFYTVACCQEQKNCPSNIKPLSLNLLLTGPLYVLKVH